MKIGVVIPAYKVCDVVCDVVKSLPPTVDHIIVVDDKCPYFSGKEVQKLSDKRIVVLYHERNEGVGGSMITGYKKAIELGCDIVIKMDGDGQMSSEYLHLLLEAIIEGDYAYAKGNRFLKSEALAAMPLTRT